MRMLLKSRALMRSAAMLHALTNEMFSLRSSTGFELNIGGTMIEEWRELVRYICMEGGQKSKDMSTRRAVGELVQRPTSAAPKR